MQIPLHFLFLIYLFIIYDFSPLALTLFFSGTLRVDVLKKDVTYAGFTKYCSLHV